MWNIETMRDQFVKTFNLSSFFQIFHLMLSLCVVIFDRIPLRMLYYPLRTFTECLFESINRGRRMIEWNN